MRRYLFLAIPAFLVACGDPGASASAASTDDAIIGGVDARSTALDAVGFLYAMRADGQASGCTGTLIAPDLVLTAKHCVLSEVAAGSPTVLDAGRKLGFRIGADERAPRHEVFASEVHTCGLDAGGSAGLGCDVALVRLQAPITDVTPLAVATGPIGADLVGQTFIGIGYGTQDSASTVSGTRKMASMKLRATTGPGLHATFPTYEDFVALIDRAEGPGVAASLGSYYRDQYDRPLLDGYEAQVGGDQGDAETCHGDSGGPLLKVTDGKLMVYGVTSTGVSGFKEVCENAGTVYATFGPEAQTLFANALAPAPAADPCASVPAAGCEGDVAVRCTRPEEGSRRIVRTDCSLLAQRCDAAACVD